MDATERKTWTVAEAKVRLSEILRMASEEGPQRIGAKTTYVLLPEEEWLKLCEPQIPLGRWLVENMPRIDDLDLPSRQEAARTPAYGNESDPRA